MKNKSLIDDAQGLLNRNINLHAELNGKVEKLKEAEDSRKKAEVACKKAKELAEMNAKKLEVSHAALLACMQEAKAALDVVFAKASSEPCEELPDADPAAFSMLLKAEVGQLVPLLDSVSDFGAYGATLAIARSFQVARCDHLKKLGRVSHHFPSVEDM